MISSTKIKLKTERVVLSDTLPYETPITFSNRFLYDFIIDNQIQADNKSISWKEVDHEVEVIICLIFGIDKAGQKKISSIENRRVYKEIRDCNKICVIAYH